MYVLGFWKSNCEDDWLKADHVARFLGTLGSNGFTKARIGCGRLFIGHSARGWFFRPQTPIDDEKEGPDLWVEFESARSLEEAINVLTYALEGTKLLIMDPATPFLCEIG